MCLCSQVDTAAQIPWYERLSEFKMPWEIKGNKQTAINKLSLTVHSGQMLALIGSSGDAQSIALLNKVIDMLCSTRTVKKKLHFLEE